MRTVSAQERRARLATRHGLTPVHRYDDVVAATRAMTVLHATEAATVHLALRARVKDVQVADVNAALEDERTLVKQLAMRRTLFVFPRELLPAAWGSASARVAATERKRLSQEAERAGLAPDGGRWLAEAERGVLACLADGVARTTAEIRTVVPEMAGQTTIGRPDSKWGGRVALGPRVLTLLGAEGEVVRGRNAGHWRLNKPRWTRTVDWLGTMPPALSPEAGYRELVRRWLWTFGPGTEGDIVWWLGSTKTAVRAALAELNAEQVALDGDRIGWLLPDDLDPVESGEPWAALLPTLDPTVMGWKERDFYLDSSHTPYLFDTNGNAGNTAWWEGRIVGAWAQDDDGVVKVLLREDIGSTGREALDAEAGRFTAWLDGTRINNVYASALMKAARLP